MGRTDPRPRILIDALGYSPHDGGFTTAMHDLLRTCGNLPEFEFVVVHERKHGAVFRSFRLATYSVVIPRSLRFFASLPLMPLIARRLRASAVHFEISAVPWFMGVPASLTVDDLYFLIDRDAGGRSIRQRLMQLYWERLFKGSIRRARICKTISESSAADMRRLVARDLSIVLAYPPIPAPPGPAPERHLPEGGEDLRLLFVGSVVPRRNLPFLLAALQAVRRPWRLDVVGSLWWGTSELGPLATDPRVHLHGYVPDSERERLMADAHLMIAPSRYEGFGYPAAEAMAGGLPIFASDASAYREFVPDAWRFPLDDPAVLSSMIETLDEERYSRMPHEARAAVAQFSAVNHRDRHRQLFEGLVARSSAAADRAADGSAGNGRSADAVEWRPGRLARARSLVRRALIASLGEGIEGRVRARYHDLLRALGRFGPPEEATSKAVLSAIAARSRTILDVGANVGRYAWFLRRHAPSDAVLFALEPHPGAAHLLRRALGGSSRSSVLEVAAGDRDGVAELVVPEGAFGASVSALSWVRTEADDGSGGVLEIGTRRIDSLVQDGTITIVDPVFIKIDVEGTEARVFRGAARLLREHRPIIYFECQTPSAVRQGETPQGVWDELGRAGYRIFASTGARLVHVERVQPDVANYLAIPWGADGLDLDAAIDTDGLVAILERWASRAADG